MILGVVSDTHNHLSNIEKIIDLFNERNVEKVIHTGDITQAKTLSKFSRLNCSLYGVYGNNDLKEIGLEEVSKINGFKIEHPPLITKLGGKKIAIFHEPEGIEDLIKDDPSIELVLHGHTHRFRNEKVGNTIIINPGECSGMLKGKNSIGIIRLQELELERIFF